MIIGTCAICLDLMTIGPQIVTLRCKHQYHKPCIQRWIDLGHNTCPIGRCIINASAVWKKYLLSVLGIGFISILLMRHQYFRIILGTYFGVIEFQRLRHRPPREAATISCLYVAIICTAFVTALLLTN